MKGCVVVWKQISWAEQWYDNSGYHRCRIFTFSDGMHCFRRRVFFSFSVRQITREPLHSAWWNFARTCSVETLIFKVIGRHYGQGHMVFCVFLCAWCCGYQRTVLSLEQGLMNLLILNLVVCRRSGACVSMATWRHWRCVTTVVRWYSAVPTVACSLTSSLTSTVTKTGRRCWRNWRHVIPAASRRHRPSSDLPRPHQRPQHASGTRLLSGWPQFGGKHSRTFQGVSSTFSTPIPVMFYRMKSESI